MADTTVRTGVDSYVLYGEESTYNTAASTINQHFGMVQNFNLTLNRNMQKIRGVQGELPSANTGTTGRDVKQHLRGNVDASFSVNVLPFNFRMLKYVFGSESGSGTAGSPYNYPRATASTEGDKKSYMTLPSLTVSTNYYFGGAGDYANRAINLTGVKVNTWTVDAALGEAIKCSYSCIGSTPVLAGTLTTPVALPTDEVFNFTGITFEIPASTPVQNIVESISFSVENSLEALRGVGSDTARRIVAGNRTFKLSVTWTLEGIEWLKTFIGSSTTLAAPGQIATAKIVFSAGATRNVTLNLLRLTIENPTANNASIGTVIKESMDFSVEQAYVTEQVTA